jgi:hypothetical protein
VRSGHPGGVVVVDQGLDERRLGAQVYDVKAPRAAEHQQIIRRGATDAEGVLGVEVRHGKALFLKLGDRVEVDEGEAGKAFGVDDLAAVGIDRYGDCLAAAAGELRDSP